MVEPLHDRWWGYVFCNKLFRGIHELVGPLKQTLCYMHVWYDLNNQNSKTLRDAKNLKKRDGCSKNGVEDRKQSVWVGGCSPFFVDDDFIAAWEFELLLEKEDETLEHYGN